MCKKEKKRQHFVMCCQHALFCLILPLTKPDQSLFKFQTTFILKYVPAITYQFSVLKYVTLGKLGKMLYSDHWKPEWCRSGICKLCMCVI